MTLLHNQLIAGGLVLMLTGALMAIFRKVPNLIYYWLQRRFSVSLTITDMDPLFEWTKIWLDSLPYSKKARSIACSLYRDVDKDYSTDSIPIFSPNYGQHFFRHKGKFIWLSRDKKDTAPNAIQRSSESITLTVLGTKQIIARDIVREIIDSANRIEQQSVKGYISGNGWWRRIPTFKPRLLETVDLPKDDEGQILDAIHNFLLSRTDYAKKGIPYHLNFLFAGLPGTGKTSIASALCGHFGFHLYILNIAGPGMQDDKLVELMLTLPRRSLLLLEDIDAVVPTRTGKPKTNKVLDSSIPSTEENKSEGITLSGLLNCLDGLTAPDGVVIVMTTNHPENLDPALLRPGRVDYRVDFTYATKEQIEKMCKRLNPTVALNGQVESMLVQKYTTARVQAEILKMN